MFIYGFFIFYIYAIHLPTCHLVFFFVFFLTIMLNETYITYIPNITLDPFDQWSLSILVDSDLHSLMKSVTRSVFYDLTKPDSGFSCQKLTCKNSFRVLFLAGLTTAVFFRVDHQSAAYRNQKVRRHQPDSQVTTLALCQLKNNIKQCW